MVKLIGGIIGVLFLWVLWALQPLIIEVLGFQSDIGKLGQWGDTFGALDALFAALGCAAIIFTLWQQQQQIKTAQDDQHYQRFESSFFVLLSLFRELRNNLRFRFSKEYIENNTSSSSARMIGIDALRFAWLEALYRINKLEFPPTKEQIAGIYEEHIHKRYENNFGPYFRTLYTILYKIKYDRILSGEQKHQYANILRIQLTSYELAVVGLNGLSNISEDFGQLITEFQLLKNLPTGKRKNTLLRYYNGQAFAVRE